MQSINLIPQAEVQEQTKVKAVRLSTWLSLAFLLIIGGVAGYCFYITQGLQSQISSVEGETSSLRKQISGMSAVEVNARNLDKKYTTLKAIFGSRITYSLLATEIEARKPADVSIDSMTIQKESELNITGQADNYIAIAALTNNLVNQDFKGGDSSLKTLFSQVTLNSVSLEKTRNVVKFSINVDLNTGLLKNR